MQLDSIPYSFSGEIWKHRSDGGWHFVSLPKELSKEIRTTSQWQEEGWGRLKAKAEVAKHSWDSAIWFDTKLECYILPLKADVRKKCGIKEGDLIEVVVYL